MANVLADVAGAVVGDDDDDGDDDGDDDDDDDLLGSGLNSSPAHGSSDNG